MSDAAAGPARRGRLIAGSTVLALSERLANRGASALVTFGMALFVSPAAAGAYAFGMLALTFAQAAGEGVLRQVGVAAWRYERGGAALVRIARLTAVFGGLFVLLALLVGRWAGLYDWAEFAVLTPLALVVAVQGWFVPRITLAQYHGQWGRLTRTQSLAGVLSLVVAVPLLPVAGILAGVLQTVVAETFFAVRAGRGLDAPAPDRGPTDVLRDFVLPTAVTNLFGWANGQMDRLMVTLLAGAGPLGLLSIALAVAKSATDAVLSGTMNLLRSRLAGAADEHERAASFSSVLVQSLLIAGMLQIVVTVASFWPLPLLLGDEWTPALAVVPLLAMSGVPMAAHYSIAAAVIDEGRARSLRTANIVSLVLAVGVGALLAYSLPLGSAAEALKDGIALAVVWPLMSGSMTRRTKMVLLVLILAATVFGVGAYALRVGLGIA